VFCFRGLVAFLNETIRAARQGDAAAFEVIYQLHCRRVYTLCLRMLRDSAEAPQDPHISRRISFFHLAAQNDSQSIGALPPYFDAANFNRGHSVSCIFTTA
jgi:hypothetical protein